VDKILRSPACQRRPESPRQTYGNGPPKTVPVLKDFRPTRIAFCNKLLVRPQDFPIFMSGRRSTNHPSVQVAPKSRRRVRSTSARTSHVPDFRLFRKKFPFTGAYEFRCDSSQFRGQPIRQCSFGAPRMSGANRDSRTTSKTIFHPRCEPWPANSLIIPQGPQVWFNRSDPTAP